jgi:hypothetical protein
MQQWDVAAASRVRTPVARRIATGVPYPRTRQVVTNQQCSKPLRGTEWTIAPIARAQGYGLGHNMFRRIGHFRSRWLRRETALTYRLTSGDHVVHGRHHVDELLGDAPLRTVREIPIGGIEPPLDATDPDDATSIEEPRSRFGGWGCSSRCSLAGEGSSTA